MNRNDYEPIVAERRSREPVREETQPLWRLVLALGAVWPQSMQGQPR